MTQVSDRPPDDTDARVDLLATISARVTEREPAIHVNGGVAVQDRDARHVRVRVLDHGTAGRSAPHDVERADALAAERAFDPRPAQAVHHHAVERPIAADGNDTRSRPQRREHAGEHPVAFLPVSTRDVELDPRSLAVSRAAVELDVRLRRSDVAHAEVDPLGAVGVNQIARDRHRLLQWPGIERPPAAPALLRGLDLRGGQEARHRLDPRRRIDPNLAIAAMVREPPKRPFQEIASSGAAGEPDAVELQHAVKRGEVDAFVRGIEAGNRRYAALSERRHPVVEPRRTAVERDGRVGDLEALGHPQQRSPHVLELVRVDGRARAREGPLELATRAGTAVHRLPEQVERTRELALALRSEVVVGEEDALHRLEIDARADLVELLGPAREIDLACQLRSGAVGPEIDAIEHHLAVHDAGRPCSCPPASARSPES